MRSMVEGYAVSSAAYDLPYPSTTLRVVPLPLRGRTSNDRFSPHNGHRKNAVLHGPAVPAFIPVLSNVDNALATGRGNRDVNRARPARRARPIGGRTRLTFPDFWVDCAGTAPTAPRPEAHIRRLSGGYIKPPSQGRWNGGSRSAFVTLLNEGAGQPGWGNRGKPKSGGRVGAFECWNSPSSLSPS
ncbi:hypothetical protein SPYCA_3209 [Sphingopyxis sp. FD7]|jgi:hypothetical protein|nr:hypothetical protein SPYCA_3209 [Sphingopyxis sp. FD7]